MMWTGLMLGMLPVGLLDRPFREWLLIEDGTRAMRSKKQIAVILRKAITDTDV